MEGSDASLQGCSPGLAAQGWDSVTLQWRWGLDSGWICSISGQPGARKLVSIWESWEAGQHRASLLQPVSSGLARRGLEGADLVAVWLDVQSLPLSFPEHHSTVMASQAGRWKTDGVTADISSALGESKLGINRLTSRRKWELPNVKNYCKYAEILHQ